MLRFAGRTVVSVVHTVPLDVVMRHDARLAAQEVAGLVGLLHVQPAAADDACGCEALLDLTGAFLREAAISTSIASF